MGVSVRDRSGSKWGKELFPQLQRGHEELLGAVQVTTAAVLLSNVMVPLQICLPVTPLTISQLSSLPTTSVALLSLLPLGICLLQSLCIPLLLSILMFCWVLEVMLEFPKTIQQTLYFITHFLSQGCLQPVRVWTPIHGPIRYSQSGRSHAVQTSHEAGCDQASLDW